MVHLYGEKFAKSIKTIYVFDPAIQLLIIYPVDTANNVKIDVYKVMNFIVVWNYKTSEET